MKFLSELAAAISTGINEQVTGTKSHDTTCPQSLKAWNITPQNDTCTCSAGQ